MITITNEKGEHLTTDKHGTFCWTTDATLAIKLADGASCARLARANAGLQEIQQHRGVVLVREDGSTSDRQPVPLLPRTDDEGKGVVT